MNTTKLRGLAEQLFYKYQLHNWKFCLVDTGRRLGYCRYDKQVIQISSYYAQHSEEIKVMDTLLHEIAHALVGPGHGHNSVWKAMALRLGATPRACDSSPETVQKPGDWQAKCPSCQRVHHKYRRPKHLAGFRCLCLAKSPLVFKRSGDIEIASFLPKVFMAKCDGCEMIHRKSQKPTSSLRCRCGTGSILVWQAVSVE